MVALASNGTPNKAKERLRDLRTQARIIEAEMRLKRLEASKKMVEAWSIWGDEFGGSDLWTRLRGDGTQPYLPISVRSDRRHGADWPMWRTIQELAEYRQKSRVLCAVNSYAKGLIKNLTNYVIGKGGFLFKAAPRKQQMAQEANPETQPDTPADPDTETQAAVAKTQWFLDEFSKANRWPQRQREAFRRTLRDGEAFVRLFFQEEGATKGMTLLRFLEPEQIDNPPNRTWADGWSYGSRHQMEPREDVESVEAYFAYYQDPATAGLIRDKETGYLRTGPDTKISLTADAGKINEKWGEEIDNAEVVHIMLPDEDSAIKRGMPLLAFDAGEALDRASKLQRNLSSGSALQAAIAWIEEFETGTAQQVSDFADGQRSFVSAPDPATGNTQNVEKFYPGQIIRTPQNKKFLPSPYNQAEQSHLEVAQGDLRQASSAVSAPEYMTGDASNANYSSTQEAGTPFVKGAEAEQEHYKSPFLDIQWRAVRWAAKCGILPANVEQLVDIQAEAPAVLHQNEYEIAQKNQILSQARIKSPQTWTMEEGLEYDQEQANWEEFDQRTGGLGTILGLPPQDAAAALKAQGAKEAGDGSQSE